MLNLKFGLVWRKLIFCLNVSFIRRLLRNCSDQSDCVYSMVLYFISMKCVCVCMRFNIWSLIFLILKLVSIMMNWFIFSVFFMRNNVFLLFNNSLKIGIFLFLNGIVCFRRFVKYLIVFQVNILIVQGLWFGCKIWQFVLSSQVMKLLLFIIGSKFWKVLIKNFFGKMKCCLFILRFCDRWLVWCVSYLVLFLLIKLYSRLGVLLVYICSICCIMFIFFGYVCRFIICIESGIKLLFNWKKNVWIIWKFMFWVYCVLYFVFMLFQFWCV